MTFQTKSQDGSPGGLSPSLPAREGGSQPDGGEGAEPQARPRVQGGPQKWQQLPPQRRRARPPVPRQVQTISKLCSLHPHAHRVPQRTVTPSGVQHRDPNPELHWPGKAPKRSHSELRRQVGEATTQARRSRGCPKKKWPQLPCMQKALRWGAPSHSPDPCH